MTSLYTGQIYTTWDIESCIGWSWQDFFGVRFGFELDFGFCELSENINDFSNEKKNKYFVTHWKKKPLLFGNTLGCLPRLIGEQSDIFHDSFPISLIIYRLTAMNLYYRFRLIRKRLIVCPNKPVLFRLIAVNHGSACLRIILVKNFSRSLKCLKNM